MKVQIQKNLLVNALEKMHDVSTKALIPDFNFSGRITIDTQPSKVVFTSSNGCITARYEITDVDDPNIKGNEKGKVTTDAVKLRDSVRKIITDESSSLIELFDDGSTLHIKDATSKRKKLVKLPRENQHHKTSSIQKPDTDSTFVESDPLFRGIATVLPFQSRAGYKFAYQVVLFHWIGKELRLVCGDGALFAIFTFPRDSRDKSKREMKRTIPGVQLSVISSLLMDSSSIEMAWADKATLWIREETKNGEGGIELMVRGLPEIDYVSYDKHAYRFDEAKAYVDVKISDLSEVAGLLGVLRDKEREEQGKCASHVLTAPSSDGLMHFEITKNQGKWQCEYEIPAIYHDLGDQPTFQSLYAHLFFDSPAHAARHPYLRLYLIEETDTVNARDVSLGAASDDGIPIIEEEPDNCQLTFFFAAIKDD